MYIFQASIFRSLTWRFHLLELGFAEVWPQEPVGEHATRASQVVDELAGGDHLVGGSGFLSQSRLGTPLMMAMTVSLSPKTSLT